MAEKKVAYTRSTVINVQKLFDVTGHLLETIERADTCLEDKDNAAVEEALNMLSSLGCRYDAYEIKKLVADIRG